MSSWIEDAATEQAEEAGIKGIEEKQPVVLADERMQKARELKQEGEKTVKAIKPSKPQKHEWKADRNNDHFAHSRAVPLTDWQLEVLNTAKDIDKRSIRYRLIEAFGPVIEDLAKEIEAGKLKK